MIDWIQKGFFSFKENIKTLFLLLKNRNYLELAGLFFLSASLFFIIHSFGKLTLVLTYFLSIGTMIVGFINCYIKQKRVFTFVFVFLFLYGLVMLVTDLFFGFQTLSQYVNIITCYSAFLIIFSFNDELRILSLRVILIVMLSFVLRSAIYYLPNFIKTGKFDFNYNGHYIANLDSLGNWYCISLILCIFFALKGDLFAVVFGIFSLAMAITTTRIGALLFVVGIIIGSLYCITQKKKYLFWCFIGLFVLGGIAFSSTPLGRPLTNRLLNLSENESLNMRLFLLIRELYFSAAHPFTGLGSNGFVGYVVVGPHSSFGLLAYQYGGLFSIIVNIFLIYIGVALIKKGALLNQKYKVITINFGLFIIIAPLFTSMLYNRVYIYFLGLACGFLENLSPLIYKEKEDKVKTYYELSI